MKLMKVYFSTVFLGAVMVVSVIAPAAVSAAARSLSVGLSGSDVTTLQNELIAKGYLTAGSNTGYFGALTLAAVEKFQCAQGIICANATVEGYGIAGPRTQSVLASATTGSASTINTGSASTGGTAATTGDGGVITGASLTGPATGKFEISGWVPDWRAATGTADVLPHLTQMTSVMPFGYTVNSDGTLDDTADITQAPWPAFIAQAKADKVRVVPTVEWGDGTAEQAILSNTTSRIALEDEIANTVKANGFDGIDIDFEAKQDVTKDYFSTFLQGLYSRMGNNWVYCTVEARQPLNDRYSPGATIPADATDYANDYSMMNKYCDRVEIMAYDQGTIDLRLDAARSAPYAPVADPGWVSDLVTLAAQSIAKNKIIIGIPDYGYEYQVTPINGAFQYNVLWAFNPAYGTQIAAQLGITPKRTSADELGFTYNPAALTTTAPTGSNSTQTQQSTPTNATVQNAGSQVDTSQPFNYVTWSDAQAIADKVQLAHQLGIKGVAIFSLGGAEDQGMWSVLH
jgi:spore germination protein YaaH